MASYVVERQPDGTYTAVVTSDRGRLTYLTGYLSEETARYSGYLATVVRPGRTWASSVRYGMRRG